NLEQDSNLSGINVNDYDAIVITGQHKDMLGFENTYTNSPIIDATGMTPEDIESAIKGTTGGDMNG
ncbi:MAG: YkuS family protein, partial [Thermoanaerobacterium sp.]|nr:YkuS family protein [Thermoanaerobacterium sp.]